VLSSDTAHAIESNADWERVISPLLEKNLWEDETAYDSSHYLMIPLHAAFWMEKDGWMEDFHKHFRRFLREKEHLPEGLKGRSARLQYLFLVSRYLVLAQESAPDDLERFLLSEMRYFWLVEPAWQWGRKPFRKGIRERIAWKLSTKDVESSYLRAIIDEELFLIGIAANLQTFLNKKRSNIPFFIKEILGTAKKIFTDEIFWNDSGGWLLQPGVWTDHPDYAYAGHQFFSDNMSKRPVQGISWDSSHSHRLPLILFSLSGSLDCDSEDFQHYVELTKALAKQFFENVVVPPDENFKFYRTKNYMDGSNGVYRFSYHPKMKRSGYPACALSGTPLIGWWVFLFDPRVPELYNNYFYNVQLMYDWLLNSDPYGEESWVFRKHFQEIIPIILKISTQMNGIYERFESKKGVVCLPR
jgi:hypothetical protein